MKEDFNYSDERFADIQMLRYRLNGFEQLSLRKKLYIYYLSQATLCGRDITFDQFGRYNIRIRKMLEQIYLHYEFGSLMAFTIIMDARSLYRDLRVGILMR